jgi:hypothetical protein
MLAEIYLKCSGSCPCPQGTACGMASSIFLFQFNEPTYQKPLNPFKSSDGRTPIFSLNEHYVEMVIRGMASEITHLPPCRDTDSTHTVSFPKLFQAVIQPFYHILTRPINQLVQSLFKALLAQPFYVFSCLKRCVLLFITAIKL